MKKEEKSKISKERIIQAAIIEFGVNGYEKASLNNVCHQNNISKGLIYHYFENKDELFLACIRISFQRLTTILKTKEYLFIQLDKDLNEYFKTRIQFFNKNEMMANLFFNAILQPPFHLEEKIYEIRKEYDLLTQSYYQKIIKNLKLRKDITEEEAIEYCILMQDIFNKSFQKHIDDEDNLKSLVDKHERKILKIMNIMLYGIAEKENENVTN